MCVCTHSMPWRKAGVKYSQNEIYLDIVEEMDAIIDNAGQVHYPHIQSIYL